MPTGKSTCWTSYVVWWAARPAAVLWICCWVSKVGALDQLQGGSGLGSALGCCQYDGIDFCIGNVADCALRCGVLFQVAVAPVHATFACGPRAHKFPCARTYVARCEGKPMACWKVVRIMCWFHVTLAQMMCRRWPSTPLLLSVHCCICGGQLSTLLLPVGRVGVPPT